MTVPGLFRASIRRFVFALVLLVFGAGCLAAASWLRPISDAEGEARGGRLQQALGSYRVAESRFSSVPLAKRFLPRVYDTIIDNELSVMYALKQYDEVIDKAGAAGTPGGHFWAGCALFAKGDLAFITPENQMKWLGEARQEFRRAIESDPGDFDAKFNYEVTSRVIAGVEKEPTAPRPKDLKLLTPSNEQTRKKVG